MKGIGLQIYANGEEALWNYKNSDMPEKIEDYK